MRAVSRHVVRHAHLLAREIEARAVLVLADAIESDEELRQLVRTVNFPAILISRARETPPTCSPPLPHCHWITVPDVHMTRTGQVKVALLVCLAKGLLQRGDRVVCLTGIDRSGVIDTCMVLNLGTEPELFSATDAVSLGGDVSPEVFERVLTLATQLAVEAGPMALSALGPNPQMRAACANANVPNRERGDLRDPQSLPLLDVQGDGHPL